MRQERRGGNYGFMSEELTDALKQTNGNAFIFLNRLGSSSYVGCRDCGNVLKCPNCDISLTFYQDSNSIVCHYCKYSRPMITSCRQCKGVNMVMYGVGTQLAENEIKKIFGKQKNVIRVDSDVKNSFITSPPLAETISTSSIIIIGTKLAWPLVDWSKLKLMVFLDADTSLFIPEYKVSEYLWYLLRDAQFRLNEQGRILVQTNHPEHIVFQSLANPNNFYQAELKERRLVEYPPFRFLLKLSYSHFKREIAEKEAHQIYNLLTAITKNNLNIKLAGPLETTPYFYGGRYSLVILAKIKYDNYKKNTKLLLSKLPDNWKVDPNPNNILMNN
jgi:primosomal protein N' (replication factor Y)